MTYSPFMVRLSLMHCKGRSLHAVKLPPHLAGDTAARRRAITELLFFASTGDLARCQRIVRLWNLKVRRLAEAACCLQVAAAPVSVQAPAAETVLSVTGHDLPWCVQVSEQDCCDYDKRTPL